MSNRRHESTMHTGVRLFVCATVVMSGLAVVLPQALRAQTLTVLHSFTGAQDGGTPFAGLTMDAAGNLYGAASEGGLNPCPSRQGFGCGTVFRLNRRGSWTFNLLYTFVGGSDGAYPVGELAIGPDGSLYGTTGIGGGGSNCETGFAEGCGTVYNLKPPARFCSSFLCPWTETVLFRFPNANAGWLPGGALTFDAAGNMYGITEEGSTADAGMVFELTSSGPGWTETVLHAFSGHPPDGSSPKSGVIFGPGGNLYGTTPDGGSSNGGIVYQLVPSGSGSTLTPLYAFQYPNILPYGGVIADAAGNLYGTTLESEGAGSIYELINQAGSWSYQLLYRLPGPPGGPPGAWGPTASLAMDAAGNLYGTTYNGGSSPNCDKGCGTIFKLTPNNGSWNYSLLHEFTGAEGALPYGRVVVDSNGNLFGTATMGGSYNEGVVWELTP